MSRYDQEVFIKLSEYITDIHQASQATGISMEAISGAIAEEYDYQLGLWGTIREEFFQRWLAVERNIDMSVVPPQGPYDPDMVRPFASKHDYLVWSYEQTIKDGKLDDSNLANRFEFKYVVTNDIGPANIRIGEAFALLENYFAANTSSDPMNLKRFMGNYDQLVDELFEGFSSEVTAYITALKLQEANDFFTEQTPLAWAVLDQDTKDAIMITYFNNGRQSILNRMTEVHYPYIAEPQHRRNITLPDGTTYTFPQYFPQPGGGDSGGLVHLENLEEIRKSLNVTKSYEDWTNLKALIALSFLDEESYTESLADISFTAEQVNNFKQYMLTGWKLGNDFLSDMRLENKHIFIDRDLSADISGSEGNDLILGYGGDDRLYGGKGSDTLYGGSNNDELYGEDDNDTLYGGSGADHLHGGSGKNELYGGQGKDSYYIGQGGYDIITDVNEGIYKLGQVFHGHDQSNQLTGGSCEDNATNSGPIVTYCSDDGRYTYIHQSSDPTKEGTLFILIGGYVKAEIKNFKSGDLDIFLTKEPKKVDFNPARKMRSPLVLDLDGDGIETIGVDSSHTFFDLVRY